MEIKKYPKRNLFYYIQGGISFLVGILLFIPGKNCFVRFLETHPKEFTLLWSTFANAFGPKPLLLILAILFLLSVFGLCFFIQLVTLVVASKWFRCPLCNRGFPVSGQRYDFCPNCGGKLSNSVAQLK